LPLILSLLILIALILIFARRRRRPGNRSKRGSSQPSLGQTQKQLYRLVNGDRHTAQRLVEKVRQRNPGRSEQWCWEKAIYDIERDRRA